jgi:hypothetical protein
VEHLSRHRGKPLRACYRPSVSRLPIGGRAAAGRLPRKVPPRSRAVNAALTSLTAAQCAEARGYLLTPRAARRASKNLKSFATR